jgi:membrane-associated phospholipid phosphatase
MLRGAVLATLLLCTAPASAQEQRLKLAPPYRRFDALEYAITAALGIGFFTIELAVTPPMERGWSGPILVDDASRSAFRGRTPDVRNFANMASDVSALLPIVYLWVDTIAVPLADKSNLDVGWQMTVMNAQALALVGVITHAMNHTARERPDTPDCRADKGYNAGCGGGEFASFPSGHAGFTMATAGLVCAHHLGLRLYGSGAADTLACLATTGVGLATGMFRVVADRHWMSDVLVGSFMGFGIGFGLPMLLHYRPFLASKTSMVTPVVTGSQVTLSWSGVF